MTIALAGINLDQMLLTPEFRPGVRASVTPTIAGGVIVQETAVVSGESVDLVGAETGPFLTKATLQALTDLAAVPGATYTLIYLSFTYVVRFRHEDTPTIEAIPFYDSPDAYDTDFYHSARIKLMIL